MLQYSTLSCVQCGTVIGHTRAKFKTILDTAFLCTGPRCLALGPDREAKRDTEIRLRWMGGEKISTLAREYGVSRQRIDQIVKKPLRRLATGKEAPDRTAA